MSGNKRPFRFFFDYGPSVYLWGEGGWIDPTSLPTTKNRALILRELAESKKEAMDPLAVLEDHDDFLIYIRFLKKIHISDRLLE